MSGSLDSLLSQTESGLVAIRNDRLLAVPVTPVNPALFGHINDLPSAWLTEIEHFFISYNRVQGREYKPIKHGAPEEAEKALAIAERGTCDAARKSQLRPRKILPAMSLNR